MSERDINLTFSLGEAYADVSEERVRRLIETHDWKITVDSKAKAGSESPVQVSVDKSALKKEGYNAREIDAAVAVITGAVIFGK